MSDEDNNRILNLKMKTMLADFATVADGKLTIVGGGFTVTGPEPTPCAIAVLMQVPWDRTNEQHHLVIDLVDEDGAPACPVGAPDGTVAMHIEAQLEVGRPPGLRRGASIDCPAAMPIPPIPLPTGKRYVWRFTLDGEHNADWDLAFEVRAPIHVGGRS